MEYIPQGVCSQKIKIDLNGDTIRNVEFIGGCDGNTTGLSRLVKGMKVQDVISKLDGITCEQKPTSCPDQLAKALKAAISET